MRAVAAARLLWYRPAQLSLARGGQTSHGQRSCSPGLRPGRPLYLIGLLKGCQWLTRPGGVDCHPESQVEISREMAQYQCISGEHKQRAAQTKHGAQLHRGTQTHTKAHHKQPHTDTHRSTEPGHIVVHCDKQTNRQTDRQTHSGAHESMLSLTVCCIFWFGV
jgi:hypothetical protein